MKGNCVMATHRQKLPKDACFCKDNAHEGDFRHKSRYTKITN